MKGLALAVEPFDILLQPTAEVKGLPKCSMLIITFFCTAAAAAGVTSCRAILLAPPRLWQGSKFDVGSTIEEC